ncbi:ribonuclease T2 isoform X2 [Chanos chanos]|uniref:Ribonuclease T2 isoform X2 n=1 Tax=Chanos chanos TaxID=29144 RepID=A0A6J2V5B6_CHACN|nr:ribonuclease T2 isoform X2 [Chanos chanos]
MRYRMKSLGVLLFLGFCLVTSSHVFHEWTKLILTHHWPQTFCTMEHCHTRFNYWTLHGLWPDRGVACNSSWHFNESLIQDILPDMEKSWPDLFNPTSTSFWKYEWHKHGTCAATAEALNSQHKYFSKALELYHKFNLDGVLKQNHIVPSEQHYTLDAVEGAILNSYGVKPKIQCLHPGKGGEFQTLGQIEICVDREFELVSCEKALDDIWSRVNDILSYALNGVTGFSVCDEDLPIYYPPLTGKF